MATPVAAASLPASEQPVSYADPDALIAGFDRALVISDTHWFHDNVIAYCGRPADHDELMLRNWREAVGPDDVVLHCGDVAVGVTADVLAERLPALPGRVFLIRGNHDYGRRLRHYVARGWSVIQPFEAEYRGWRVLFTHKPASDLPSRTLNVHGHIHTHAAPSAAHVNVSVEQLGYRPRLLTELLDAAINRL